MQQTRRKQSGFSTVEMIIAVSISAVVVMATAAVFKQLAKSRENAMNEMNTQSSESIGGLQIYMDLLSADVFNLLESKVCEVSGASLSDVKAKEATEFFLHNPTANGCELASPAESCKRSKKITLGSNDRIVLTLIRKMATASQAAQIQPGTRTLRPTILFEDIPPASNPFRTSGSLSFSPDGRLRDTLRAYGFVKPGQMIRVLSPFETRALASDGNGFDYDVAPRYPSLTMMVNDSGNIVPANVPGTNCQPRWGFENAAGANQVVDSLNPGVGTDVIEAYFRLLGPDAGLNSWVKVSVIETISYSLVKEILGGRSVGRLVRSVWNPVTAAWEKERVIVDGVASFTLKRQNIRTPSLFYEVERQRK